MEANNRFQIIGHEHDGTPIVLDSWVDLDLDLPGDLHPPDLENFHRRVIGAKPDDEITIMERDGIPVVSTDRATAQRLGLVPA